MARRRTATNVLDATGAFQKNPKRRNARKNEPKPTGKIGDPPKWFDKNREGVWRELVEQSAPGVLTNSDRAVLERVSDLLWQSREKPGEFPAAKDNLLMRGLSMIGMTPADRSKISAVQDDKPTSEFDGF